MRTNTSDIFEWGVFGSMTRWVSSVVESPKVPYSLKITAILLYLNGIKVVLLVAMGPVFAVCFGAVWLLMQGVTHIFPN